ncbi:MAG: hypothetical protein R2769_10665 [Saprospiraceae bacterium]
MIDVTPSKLNFQIADLNGANLQTVSIPLNGTSEGEFCILILLKKTLHVQTILPPGIWFLKDM